MAKLASREPSAIFIEPLGGLGVWRCHISPDAGGRNRIKVYLGAFALRSRIYDVLLEKYSLRLYSPAVQIINSDNLCYPMCSYAYLYIFMLSALCIPKSSKLVQTRLALCKYVLPTYIKRFELKCFRDILYILYKLLLGSGLHSYPCPLWIIEHVIQYSSFVSLQNVLTLKPALLGEYYIISGTKHSRVDDD